MSLICPVERFEFNSAICMSLYSILRKKATSLACPSLNKSRNSEMRLDKDDLFDRIKRQHIRESEEGGSDGVP